MIFIHHYHDYNLHSEEIYFTRTNYKIYTDTVEVYNFFKYIISQAGPSTMAGRAGNSNNKNKPPDKVAPKSTPKPAPATRSQASTTPHAFPTDKSGAELLISNHNQNSSYANVAKATEVVVYTDGEEEDSTELNAGSEEEPNCNAVMTYNMNSNSVALEKSTRPCEIVVNHFGSITTDTVTHDTEMERMRAENIQLTQALQLETARRLQQEEQESAGGVQHRNQKKYHSHIQREQGNGLRVLKLTNVQIITFQSFVKLTIWPRVKFVNDKLLHDKPKVLERCCTSLGFTSMQDQAAFRSHVVTKLKYVLTQRRAYLVKKLKAVVIGKSLKYLHSPEVIKDYH